MTTDENMENNLKEQQLDNDNQSGGLTENKDSSDSIGFSFKAEDLDLHEEIDFENLDDDILRFQQDPLVHEALHKAVDLKEYSAKIESDLRGIEIESIDDYLKESERLAQLHSQIKDCDEILEVMENMLGGFQKDLGGISDEIQSLQNNSYTLNVKLKNRVSAYNQIDEYVTSLYVPEEVSRRIADGAVDEHFMHAVQVLDRHADFLAEQRKRGIDAKSLDDVEPHIKKICAKAVHKLRDFLLKQFQTLRKPRTNIQIVQANVLIEYNIAYSFLAKHNSDAAQDVRNFYIDTMSKVYYNHLKHYVNSLLKLQTSHPVKGDFVVENTSFRSLFSSKKALKSKSAIFELGDREKILDMDETARIVPHISQKQQQRFPFEQLFRSMLIMLIDIASQEYLFCGRFFGAASSATLFDGAASPRSRHGNSSSSSGSGSGGSIDPDIFSQIFEKSLDLIRHTTEQYLQSSYDPIAVLLMIRVCQNCLLVMSRRRVPCLDGFLDELNMTLWPRFKNIIECNVQSIRDASPSHLFDGNINGHVVALRYAELVGSVQRINPFHTDIFNSVNSESNSGASSPSTPESRNNGKENGKFFSSSSSSSLNTTENKQNNNANNNSTNGNNSNNSNITRHSQGFDTVDRSISILRGELERLLIEMSRLFRSKNERLVFLINSMDKIVIHLQESGLSSSECDELSNAISLRDAHIDAFVEEELNLYYPDMIKFVVRIEKRLSDKSLSERQCKQEYLESMEHLAKEFADTWKDVLRRLYEDMLKYFANFKTGTEICRKLFLQLMFYYVRFVRIVTNTCGKSFRGPIVKQNDISYKISNHYTINL